MFRRFFFIASFCAFTLAKIGWAQTPVIQHFAVLRLDPGENEVTNLLIDDKHGYVYAATADDNFRFSLDKASAHILKVRMADFSRINKMTLPTGLNPLDTGVLNSNDGFLYYGTYGDPNRSMPAKIIKIGLLDFKSNKVINLENDDYGLSSAILDTNKNEAYLGTLFGSVVHVQLDKLELQGNLSLQKEDNAFQCAVIDRHKQFAYFGTSAGNIMKIQLSDFNPTANLSALRSEKGFRCAVVDGGDHYAYFGTQESPGRIVRIDLSDFSPQGTLSLGPGESNLISAFIDEPQGIAYFIAAAPPARLIRVRLSDFELLDSIPLPNQANPTRSAVWDGTHHALYLGISGTPGKIVKVPFGQ